MFPLKNLARKGLTLVILEVEYLGVNAMFIDALVPKVARALAGMVSAALDMYCCSRVNFMYLDQNESKIWFKMCIDLLWCLKKIQHVNSLRPNDTYMRQCTIPSLVKIMACCLVGTKRYLNQFWNIINWTLKTSVKFLSKLKNFVDKFVFEIVVCEMVAILPQPQYVKSFNK